MCNDGFLLLFAMICGLALTMVVITWMETHPRHRNKKYHSITRAASTLPYNDLDVS